MPETTITDGRHRGMTAKEVAIENGAYMLEFEGETRVYRKPSRKPYNVYAGYRGGRVNPLTGDYLTLYDGREQGLEDDPEARWCVVCEAHSTLVGHASQASAYATLKSGATEFCDHCRELEATGRSSYEDTR